MQEVQKGLFLSFLCSGVISVKDLSFLLRDAVIPVYEWLLLLQGTKLQKPFFFFCAFAT